MLGNIKNYLLMIVIVLGIVGTSGFVSAAPGKNELIKDINTFYNKYFARVDNIYLKEIPVEASTELKILMDKVTIFVVGNEREDRVRAANVRKLAGIYRETIKNLQLIYKSMRSKKIKFARSDFITQSELLQSISINFISFSVYLKDILRMNFLDLVLKRDTIAAGVLNETRGGLDKCYLGGCKDRYAVLIELATSLQGVFEKLRDDFTPISEAFDTRTF